VYRGYDLLMGVGIAQGFATIGGIGFPGRIDYGAIGTVTVSVLPSHLAYQG